MSKIQSELIIATSIATSGLPEELMVPTADVFHVDFSVLGIDEVKDLITKSATKAVGENGRLFVVRFSRATVEAQNALLKLLEEPPADSVFYIVVPHPSVLIPTVSSRLISVRSGNIESLMGEESKEFLALDYGARVNMIADKVKNKETEWMERIVRDVASHVATDASSFSSDCVRSVTTGLRYFFINGASKKAILEDIALAVPVYPLN